MKMTSCTKALIQALLAFLLSSCGQTPLSQNHLNSWTWQDYLSPSVRNSTWAMMSERFQLTSAYQQPEVKKQLAWFKKNGYYFTLLTKNARPYLYYVYNEASKRHIPPEIALLPMVESNYNPFLYSSQGATGLWQMMPGTATGFGLQINWWYDGRRDIVASTDAALNYLSYLHRFFHNWLLAAAAYNAGEGTVQNAVRHNKKMHRPTDYWHLALPAETKNYIPKLLAIADIIHQPDHYGIKLSPIAYKPYFVQVPLSSQYNLNTLAKLANITPKQIRQLNPGFRRFSTTPNQAFALLVPVDKSATFSANLSHTKGGAINWTHHRVVSGDTLSELARRYHTKTHIIKEINHLSTNQLKINQSLLIPESTDQVTPLQKQSASIAEDNLPGPSKIK